MESEAQMQIPDEIRLGAELLGLFLTVGTAAGTVLTKLGRLGERFDQHGEKLVAIEEKSDTRMDKIEKTIDKIEETIQVIAVQKEAIQSIRDLMAANTKRTDETFTRIFTILDAQRGRGA